MHDFDLLDINQPDYPTELNKALGLQARPPGALDPRVGVSVTLDDFTGPEFWWLRRGIRGFAGDRMLAVAGQFGFFGLQCLKGSLLVVEQLVIASPLAAQYLSIGVQSAPPVAPVTISPGPLDTRALGQGGSARSMIGTSAAPTGPTTPVRVWCAAGTTLLLPLGAIVSAGNWVTVIGTVANTEMAVSAVYRERRMLDSES